MINKSKLTVLAAVLAVSMASPAFAQSFSKGDGTGNSLSFVYGPGGNKPAWTVAPENDQIAARQSSSNKIAVRPNGRTEVAAAGARGLHAYAAVPPTSRSTPDANAPALTGGGSTGYNQMLLTY